MPKGTSQWERTTQPPHGHAREDLGYEQGLGTIQLHPKGDMAM